LGRGGTDGRDEGGIGGIGGGEGRGATAGRDSRGAMKDEVGVVVHAAEVAATPDTTVSSWLRTEGEGGIAEWTKAEVPEAIVSIRLCNRTSTCAERD